MIIELTDNELKMIVNALGAYEDWFNCSDDEHDPYWDAVLALASRLEKEVK